MTVACCDFVIDSQKVYGALNCETYSVYELLLKNKNFKLFPTNQE